MRPTSNETNRIAKLQYHQTSKCRKNTCYYGLSSSENPNFNIKCHEVDMQIGRRQIPTYSKAAHTNHNAGGGGV